MTCPSSLIGLIHDQQGLEDETAGVFLTENLALAKASMLLPLSKVANRSPVAHQRIEEPPLRGALCTESKHRTELVLGSGDSGRIDLMLAHQAIREGRQRLAAIVPDLSGVSLRAGPEKHLRVNPLLVGLWMSRPKTWRVDVALDE